MKQTCDVFDEYGNYKYPSDVELAEPNTATSMLCEDVISRQAVLEVVNNPLNIRLDKIIENLPPVTPQPKTGRWLDHPEGHWIYAKCSACKTIHDTKTNYCPYCGCYMMETPENEAL